MQQHRQRPPRPSEPPPQRPPKPRPFLKAPPLKRPRPTGPLPSAKADPQPPSVPSVTPVPPGPHASGQHHGKETPQPTLDLLDSVPSGTTRPKEFSLISMGSTATTPDDPLLHSGSWVSPEYHKFKLLPQTGYWTCCGNHHHFSTHCPGFEARVQQRDLEFSRFIKTQVASARHRQAARFRAKWEASEPGEKQRGGATPEQNAARPFVRRQWLERLAQLEANQREGVQGPGIGGDTSRAKETDGPSSAAGSAPDGRDEDVSALGTATKGLKREHVLAIVHLLTDALANAFVAMDCLEALLAVVEEHSEDAEPCGAPAGHQKARTSGALLCVQQGAVPVTLAALREHMGHVKIERLGMRLLHTFAAKGETRRALVGNAEAAEACTVRLGSFRAVEELAAQAMFVLRVALEGALKNQRRFVVRGGIASTASILVRHSLDAGITESCLRVMQHVSNPLPGRKEVLRQRAVELALKAIGRHSLNHPVLRAALGLLLLVCESAKGRRRVLSAGGLKRVFWSLQSLVGEADFQRRGIQMLQCLVTEEAKARKELEEIPGGYQWLCQGTPAGEVLNRYAPGERQILGWTISEEERINTEAALAEAARLAEKWTPAKLMEFLGAEKEGGGGVHKLEVNNRFPRAYFSVVEEVGLLPTRGEARWEWLDRVRKYEAANHSLTDLAHRNLSM